MPHVLNFEQTMPIPKYGKIFIPLVKTEFWWKKWEIKQVETSRAEHPTQSPDMTEEEIRAEYPIQGPVETAEASEEATEEEYGLNILHIRSYCATKSTQRTNLGGKEWDRSAVGPELLEN